MIGQYCWWRMNIITEYYLRRIYLDARKEEQDLYVEVRSLQRLTDNI